MTASMGSMELISLRAISSLRFSGDPGRHRMSLAITAMIATLKVIPKEGLTFNGG